MKQYITKSLIEKRGRELKCIYPLQKIAITRGINKIKNTKGRTKRNQAFAHLLATLKIKESQIYK